MNVKALRGQFRPTFSEEEQLCKKGLKYQVACQKKPAACHMCHCYYDLDIIIILKITI